MRDIVDDVYKIRHQKKFFKNWLGANRDRWGVFFEKIFFRPKFYVSRGVFGLSRGGFLVGALRCFAACHKTFVACLAGGFGRGVYCFFLTSRRAIKLLWFVSREQSIVHSGVFWSCRDARGAV